ncbi:MAG: HAMP domain-containing sensor histidine kinase, partial [Gemmataceae bacterium]
MFWRLFFTYLLLVAVAVVAVLLAKDVVAGAILTVIAGVGASYLLAERFSRPLTALTEGASRIADGDLGHKIHVAGAPEFVKLARTFNGMSDRLVQTFTQVERDREQLRTILSGMVEGVIAFDNQERVLFANERAGVLLQFAPELAVGRPIIEIARQRVVQEIVHKALEGIAPHRQDIDWNGPEPRNLALYCQRLPGPDSPGAVMVLHDMTELRRLERMRQDFVANVSHELKTPLTVIQSNMEALLDGAIDDPVIRPTFLERVVLEAHRLGALIQDLLRLARIESDGLQLDFRKLRIADSVSECLDRHAIRAEDKTLRFIEVPGVNPTLTVWADDMALSQILDNLVDNAIKYSTSGGKITVRWGASADMVRIEVEDTGPGISERDLPRIFERFYRVDKARTRQEGGTGLGLAIVKHLIQVMNGSITVTSTLNLGTTFVVMLP